MDVTWSETGDRYMLKLFRDYLFHSVNEDGTPWLDHAHIVQCLNKLDSGTMEKVISREITNNFADFNVIRFMWLGSTCIEGWTIDFNCNICRIEALHGTGIFRINIKCNHITIKSCKHTYTHKVSQPAHFTQCE